MQGNSVRQLDVLINFEDISGRTALAIAALHNHLHAVKVLCDLGADLDPTKGTRWIPLVEAVKGGAFEIVKTLLKAGASVTWTDPMTKTHLLHLAVDAQSPELVRFLLQLGADANVHDQWKRTPLHWAIDKSRARSNQNGKIEKLLLDAGANINAQDILGN
ncbi:ankyrin repeat-containing domain protein [Gongronella butleri]|nr:ankyrin repeat-containing domain protein [Gongronella butleri]